MTSAPPPLVIAHRGASGYRPEHTRAAFDLAIALGADAVEPDLVASRDGVLVVRHENEISGTTDVAARPEFADRRTTKTVDGAEVTGWFTEDLDWAELATLRTRERLPRIRPRNTAFDGAEPLLRLDDLLAIVDGAPGVRLVAELKHAAYFASIGLPLEPLLVATLDRSGWSGSRRLTVECFELTPLRHLRAAGLAAEYVYLVEASGVPADRPDDPYADAVTDAGLDALAAEVDGISVPKSLLLDPSHNPGLVARAHARGLRVYCWTLRAENRFLTRRHRTLGPPAAHGHWREEFAEVLAAGVDGVFADQPDLALEARAARPSPAVT